MPITPIDNAMLQRTADVNYVKHQEDVKPAVDQQNIQVQVNQREDVLNHQVIDPGNSNRAHNDADAKDGGRGGYRSSKGAKKKEKVAEPTERVILKKSKTSFDMKI